MSPRSKRWLFSGVLLLLLLAFFEGLNFAVLHVVEWWHPGCVVELYVKDLFREHVTAKDVRGYGSHDPELGWVNGPNMAYSAKNVAGVEWTFTSDERGARGGEGNAGPRLVTTYGDSFTAAVEVDDDQTWEVYLSRELGGAVLNFGVTAYCPVQAVLRMERHLHQGLVAPVTVLGFWEGDLFRMVNRYRPYFAPEENGWNLLSRPCGRAMVRCGCCPISGARGASTWRSSVGKPFSPPTTTSGPSGGPGSLSPTAGRPFACSSAARGKAGRSKPCGPPRRASSCCTIC